MFAPDPLMYMRIYGWCNMTSFQRGSPVFLGCVNSPLVRYVAVWSIRYPPVTVTQQTSVCMFCRPPDFYDKDPSWRAKVDGIPYLEHDDAVTVVDIEPHTGKGMCARVWCDGGKTVPVPLGCARLTWVRGMFGATVMSAHMRMGMYVYVTPTPHYFNAYHFKFPTEYVHVSERRAGCDWLC